MGADFTTQWIAALSGAPEGHPSHVPCSPRGGAEGWTRHTPLSAAFPPERSGGGECGDIQKP